MATDISSQGDDASANGVFLADGALLEQFIKERNHDAFAALMQRHGPYLLAVCRQLTQHAQDAEDVFQACFLQLIRKGPTIRQSGSVVGWLQTVAVRLAHKVRLRAAQQRRKEAEKPMSDVAPPADLSWREACQILQEEIALLPEDLRAPIILCLFQGHTQDEAAQDLGINPRTVKDRLRRGREMLHQRLLSRGVALSILGTLLAGGVLDGAIPAALAQSTLQGAAAVASRSSLTGVVSPAVIGLAGSSSGMAAWLAVALAAVALLLGALATYAVRDWLASPPDRRLLTVQRSFRGKQFDGVFFQWAGPNAERFVRLEEEGLRITLPAGNGPGDAVGVKLRHRVRGDMEIDATFELLNVPRPDAGSVGGVTVYFLLASPENDGLWLGKMHDGLRGPLFQTGLRTGKAEKRVSKFVKTIPTPTETGLARIRIVRKGATFSFFAAEGDAADLLPVETVDVSADDCTIVRFAADRAQRPNVGVDVRLIDFTITAEEFVGYEPNVR